MKTTTLERTSSQQFIELVLQGMDCWIQAGAIAAKSIEENPSFIDEVCAACPDITEEAVRRFQAIGLQRLHPRLAISEAPGVRRLRRLPYELQCKYVSSPIEMLVRSDSGWDTLQVDVRNLTPDQAAQVFCEDGIRTAAAQRAYIEDKKAKQVAPPATGNLPYRLVGKKLVVVSACTLDRRELAKLLADMES